MNRTARQLLATLAALCSLLWSAALLIVVCTALGLMGWRVHWAILAEGRPNVAAVVMAGVLAAIGATIVGWSIVQVRRAERSRR